MICASLANPLRLFLWYDGCFNLVDILTYDASSYFSGPTPSSYRVDYTNIDTKASDSVSVVSPSATLLGLSSGSSYAFSITPMLNQLEGGATPLTTVLIPKGQFVISQDFILLKSIFLTGF